MDNASLSKSSICYRTAKTNRHASRLRWKPLKALSQTREKKPLWSHSMSSCRALIRMEILWRFKNRLGFFENRNWLWDMNMVIRCYERGCARKGFKSTHLPFQTQYWLCLEGIDGHLSNISNTKTSGIEFRCSPWRYKECHGLQNNTLTLFFRDRIYRNKWGHKTLLHQNILALVPY